jgi:hypothetical protein
MAPKKVRKRKRFYIYLVNGQLRSVCAQQRAREVLFRLFLARVFISDSTDGKSLAECRCITIGLV